jgi:tetrahydromethanopterin S-methyltransferase subunit C
MGWASLGLTLLGAIIALVSWFAFQNMAGTVVGIILAIIGLLFKPSTG